MNYDTLYELALAKIINETFNKLPKEEWNKKNIKDSIEKSGLNIIDNKFLSFFPIIYKIEKKKKLFKIDGK